MLRRLYNSSNKKSLERGILDGRTGVRMSVEWFELSLLFGSLLFLLLLLRLCVFFFFTLFCEKKLCLVLLQLLGMKVLSFLIKEPFSTVFTLTNEILDHLFNFLVGNLELSGTEGALLSFFQTLTAHLMTTDGLLENCTLETHQTCLKCRTLRFVFLKFVLNLVFDLFHVCLCYFRNEETETNLQQ